MTIAPIATAPELVDPVSGDGVLLHGCDAGAAALTHDGAANFIVQHHNDDFLVGSPGRKPKLSLHAWNSLAA